MRGEPRMETLRMSDGVLLQAAVAAPESTPEGVVQIVHGFGEHTGSYMGLAGFLVKNGYACVVHDQRGFGQRPGLTDRQRRRDNGIIPNYDCFLEDISAVREKIGVWFPDLPVTLYGHSMGGNIAVNYLLRRTQKAHVRAVLETPWLRLYKPMPEAFMGLARLLGHMSPRLAVTKPLEYAQITRDPKSIEVLSLDPYYHNRISFRLFAQVTAAGEYALANAGKLTLPVLLFCAGEDKIVCPKAIRTFAANAGKNLILREYPDGYHALHGDLCKAEVGQDTLAFCRGKDIVCGKEDK